MASAGGQELQPWLVNNSTTPAGFFTSPASAWTNETPRKTVAAVSRKTSPLFMVVPFLAGLPGLKSFD